MILVSIKSVKARLYANVKQASTIKDASILFIIEKFIITDMVKKIPETLKCRGL
jgi:hypothetical protein